MFEEVRVGDESEKQEMGKRDELWVPYFFLLLFLCSSFCGFVGNFREAGCWD